MDKDAELIQVSTNEDGNFYFVYKVPVQRGIKGKTKSKVDELIIVGVNKNKVDQFCKAQGIILKKEEL